MGDALGDDVPSVAIGDVIGGKYRVESLIGSGAMGFVYRAQHIGLQTKVAIKVLRSDRVHDDQAQRRFAREARATSSLRSPHAIRTFDTDRLPDGIPYIVMEYLEGEDLAATLVARGALPMIDAVRHLIDACDAVGEAHRLSIIHRDIKPANLFVTRAGIVKVLDFGLAKNLPALLSDAGSESTKTNLLLGSPHYMSPEQLRSAREVDARADIWSLGATLYHLLCGVPPFFGSNLYVLIALILNDEAPRLEAELPNAPPELAAVVARCLRRDREERYASCAELRRALEDVLVRLPAAAYEQPTRTGAASPSLRQREMFTSTMDAAVPAIPRLSDDVDDAEPTALTASPFDDDDLPETQSPPPSSAIPRLYDDEVSSSVPPQEHAGTLLMPQTLDRLLAKAPGAVPRVYDDDQELLPDVTKLMLESPYRPASSPALPVTPRHWSMDAPALPPFPRPPALPAPLAGPASKRPLVVAVAVLALALLAVVVLARCA